ncbi:XRE family transcriptional regulator [Salmonella enterica]|uniref:XRE family transcriptional regulator n=2 Tax=Salmonella enterica TaxID=28901 RepID=A0A402WNZ2_SALER|nr:XRE family transcriptional regulator [Salmonella enterica]PTU40369.1 hypothetical protein DAY03_19490 [Salmonella enterica subsp. enterica]EAS2066846.1 XRE family transcriptional regulator [Salmonella enterica]EAS2072077.1 XRE family transcriptional regulator [Salmonella enterica]EAX5489904.1 helix-turn-helix transcriptional regulator [Salmonella enterica]
MSQYESSLHRPRFEMVCALANVLNVPESYFYTRNDDFAEAIRLLYLQRKMSS